MSLTGDNRNVVTQLLPLLDKIPAAAGVVGRPRACERHFECGEDGPADLLRGGVLGHAADEMHPVPPLV